MGNLLSAPEIIAMPQRSTGVFSAATALNWHLPVSQNLAVQGGLLLPGCMGGLTQAAGLALPGIRMLPPAPKNSSPLPRSQDCLRDQGTLLGSAALRASKETPPGWPSARSLWLQGELGTAPADGET